MAEKAIFFDRDNTLIEDLGYINHPNQVVLIEGVPEALSTLKTLGYKLVLVTNQSAVARGIITEKDLKEIHNHLEQMLHEHGVTLDRIYYCPFHPDGVIEKYRKESDWRKPAPGMFLRAAKDMDILLDQSWCIGDSIRDIEAGSRAGCKTIMVNGSRPENRPKPGQLQPDYMAVNLREAVNIIKQHLRTHEAESSKPESPSPKEAALLPSEPLPENKSGEHHKPPQPAPGSTESPVPTRDRPPDDTTALLKGILEQVKAMSRERMFHEFSLLRLVAGITQMVVCLCLLIALWLLMSPDKRHNAVHTAVGFAMVFQVMALTFYTMDRR